VPVSDSRVVKYRGGFGEPIRPALSSAGASLALLYSVSTSRSSRPGVPGTPRAVFPHQSSALGLGTAPE